MKYSVKMILKYTVESGEEFIEESIILLDADSFDDAYERAEQYVQEYGVGEPYTNIFGKQVNIEVSYSDCYSVYDEDDVMEVYSSVKRGTEERPADLIDAVLDDFASREEMLPLRQWPDEETDQDV